MADAAGPEVAGNEKWKNSYFGNFGVCPRDYFESCTSDSVNYYVNILTFSIGLYFCERFSPFVDKVKLNYRFE